MKNQTILQYFEWYIPQDAAHWRRTALDAAHLAELGVTDVWLPPAYKGSEGMNDVGYGVYDLYDLGEFFQKGTIPTKYGTRDEYLAAIRALHDNGLRVIVDIVLNHKIGADYWEETEADKFSLDDRKDVRKHNKKIHAWTGFNFPGRKKKYSKYLWNKDCFSGVDWDENTQKKYIFKLKDHDWSRKVDNEKGNFDYLMGADIDFSRDHVQEELIRWGKWYLDTTGADGFRLDAVKHITYDFFPKWLKAMREHAGRELFVVAEYWSADLNRLTNYMKNVFNVAYANPVPLNQPFQPSWADVGTDLLETRAQYGGARALTPENKASLDPREQAEYLRKAGVPMRLFDVPLQDHFKKAGDGTHDFKLNEIFKGTLLEIDPEHAVTFVDNHDTQPTQDLKNWVAAWFKPLAYALILLRKDGVPCVFYGDLYGMDFEEKDPVRELGDLMQARQTYAYGTQTDYFDHGNTIGWTREGGDQGGMAVLMTNGTQDGWKEMAVGNPGDVFVDLLGNRSEEIVIDSKGDGRFTCSSRSVSVWIPKK